MPQNKTPNPNVSTSAILVARFKETGDTLKIGAILLDHKSNSEFVLIRHGIDFSQFVDPNRPDSGYIKLQLIVKDTEND